MGIFDSTIDLDVLLSLIAIFLAIITKWTNIFNDKTRNRLLFVLVSIVTLAVPIVVVYRLSIWVAFSIPAQSVAAFTSRSIWIAAFSGLIWGLIWSLLPLPSKSLLEWCVGFLQEDLPNETK